jgi:hypothetical protein
MCSSGNGGLPGAKALASESGCQSRSATRRAGYSSPQHQRRIPIDFRADQHPVHLTRSGQKPTWSTLTTIKLAIDGTAPINAPKRRISPIEVDDIGPSIARIISAAADGGGQP